MTVNHSEGKILEIAYPELPLISVYRAYFISRIFSSCCCSFKDSDFLSHLFPRMRMSTNKKDYCSKLRLISPVDFR